MKFKSLRDILMFAMTKEKSSVRFYHVLNLEDQIALLTQPHKK